MKKIVIIGAGPGGYPAALKARESGAEVVLVEKKYAGGVCLNCGCIPSKSYLDAAHRFSIVKELKKLVADSAASDCDKLAASFDWAKIQTRRAGVLEKFRTSLKKTFEAKGIRYIEGTASFVSDTEISIATATGEVREKFDNAIIAVGTKAFLPPAFAAVKDSLLDNESVFGLEHMPASIAVIGAGAIGVEFSCVFNALGSRVELIEMQPTVLPGEDEAVCRLLQGSFQKRGVHLHLGKGVASVSVEGSIKKVIFQDGTSVEAEAVLVAAGRVAALDELKPENAGIAWNRKGIKVDEFLRTEKKHIYAIGDVNGLSLLAHAATAQGEAAAAHIAGEDCKYDNTLIPRCIYSWPEVACVGMSKKQAEAAGIAVKTQRSFLLACGRALAQDETEGFVQIVSDSATGRILGAQLAGAYATEIIHSLAVAITAQMTVKQLRHVVFAHPTVSEMVHDALGK